MTDRFRPYDTALSRMSRRQLLDVAWKLGAAAIVQAAVPARVLAQPLYRT
jgi:hypothetical protein